MGYGSKLSSSIRIPATLHLNLLLNQVHDHFLNTFVTKLHQVSFIIFYLFTSWRHIFIFHKFDWSEFTLLFQKTIFEHCVALFDIIILMSPYIFNWIAVTKIRWTLYSPKLKFRCLTIFMQSLHFCVLCSTPENNFGLVSCQLFCIIGINSNITIIKK